MEINKLQHIMQLLIDLLFWLGVIAALVYCLVCLFLVVKQPRFIFFPSPVVEITPEYFNLPHEEVWLTVALGSNKVEYIHGWWIEAKKPDAKVLLYLHGNGINIGANVAHARRLHQLGFSVLLIDYRGYGRSQGGFPNEAQVYQDATVAWNYLVQLRSIEPSRIFIYGHSLGGAIAIDLAVEQPEAAGLIVESSFTSIRRMIAERNIFWMFPVDLILTQRFDSIKKVSELQIPVLFIHGSDDLTVPALMSQQLYDAAPEPKKILIVSGAGHNDVAEVAPSVYRQAVMSFVERAFSHK